MTKMQKKCWIFFLLGSSIASWTVIVTGTTPPIAIQATTVGSSTRSIVNPNNFQRSSSRSRRSRNDADVVLSTRNGRGNRWNLHEAAIVLTVPHGGGRRTNLMGRRTKPEHVAKTIVDWTSIMKYTIGLTVQMVLLYGFLRVLDYVVASTFLTIPFGVNVLLLYVFNLKTSVFSILTQTKGSERKKLSVLSVVMWPFLTFRIERKITPTWTPPPIAFVLGWPILTFGLRAYTAAMIVEQCHGRYATVPLMALMLHLCIGNLWNTVNTIEQRLGVSVVVLWCLWWTKAFAAYQFYVVDHHAGILLACTLPWISAAVALQTRTWQLNPMTTTRTRRSTRTGGNNKQNNVVQQLAPLIPRKPRKNKNDSRTPSSITKFKWE